MRNEWRNAECGKVIPTVHYCDQPYVVKTGDGAWLCCVTTGAGHEGEPGQHVLTQRSLDMGKTWQDAVKVEPDCPYENSYAGLLKGPAGRVFIFYNHNTDNVREALFMDGKSTFSRVDSLGHFVYKYSDDHGLSWSPERYDIPFRLFRCDRENVYGGKLCYFWNVGHPFAHEGAAYVPLTKIGRMSPVGFFFQDEGVLLRSPDLLTLADPGRASWETLPDGDTGLRTPPGGGTVAEEHNFTVLGDGSFHDTYRTNDGAPCEAYSRDGGHTWPLVRWMRHPDGRELKHIRAANFVWRCANGKYLYWFHNHGGRKFIDPSTAWGDRNPVWLAPGVEADTPEGRMIQWGEPELLLYHGDVRKGMSYPDMIEDGGRYFFTETDKTTARTHEVPAEFLNKMWDALEGRPIDIAAKELEGNVLPELCGGGGFALEFEVTEPGVVFDSTGVDGRGVRVEWTPERRIVFSIDDSRQEARAVSQRVPELRKAVIIVDGGPGVISFVVDGRLLDGGDEFEFGWRRFNPQMRSCVNPAPWRTGDAVKKFRVWDAALMTAEAVALTRP